MWPPACCLSYWCLSFYILGKRGYALSVKVVLKPLSSGMSQKAQGRATGAHWMLWADWGEETAAQARHAERPACSSLLAEWGGEGHCQFRQCYSRTPGWIGLILYVLRIDSKVAHRQSKLDLSFPHMYFEMGVSCSWDWSWSEFCSSCLYLLSSGTTGVYDGDHHQLIWPIIRIEN